MINIIEKIMSMLWLMLLLSLPAAASSSNARPGCEEKCGDVSVPYPFGIDVPKCAMDKYFFLNCNRSVSSPQLLFGINIEAFNISIEDGTMIGSIWTAQGCYNDLVGYNYTDVRIDLGEGPFRFSDTRNKLTAFGCDTYAYMGDLVGSFWSGCISICNNESAKITENSCSGIGCCHTPLPKSTKSLNITLRSAYNHSRLGNFMPCDYAFLADETFNLLDFQLSDYDKSSSNAKIEWVVKEGKCPDDQNSNVYRCGDNTNCYYSENGEGYRCLCKPGFQGNPYLGCHDIDECKEKERYHCEGTCKNTFGNYTCDCPIGMHGDGKVSCQGFCITSIAAGCNGYELPVKHRLEIPANHNSELDQRKMKKNEGKTSVVCARFCKCEKNRSEGAFLYSREDVTAFVLNFRIQYILINCYNSQINLMN